MSNSHVSPVPQVQPLPVGDQAAEDLVSGARLSELFLQPAARAWRRGRRQELSSASWPRPLYPVNCNRLDERGCGEENQEMYNKTTKNYKINIQKSPLSPPALIQRKRRKEKKLSINRSIFLFYFAFEIKTRKKKLCLLLSPPHITKLVNIVNIYHGLFNFTRNKNAEQTNNKKEMRS